ncbi:MAG: hypothetical protein PHS02_02340 [Candidatus ainarchaeum sp.]|nr:hypothetical protein [Candidatus ainarchaeum sp.]
MKAQLSMEFYASMVMLLVVFAAVLGVAYGEAQNLFQMQDWLTAKYIAQKLAFSINKVYVAGDGASSSIVLEDSGRENITISNGQVIVRRGKAVSSWPLLTTKVNTTFVSGNEITIVNNRGTMGVG